MTISTDNELDELLSIIGGEQWIRTSLARLSSDELRLVVSRSEDGARAAAAHLVQIGSVIGRGDPDLEKNEISALGWITRELAEKAEVCNTLAAFAREFADPELRDIHMQIVAARAND